MQSKSGNEGRIQPDRSVDTSGQYCPAPMLEAHRAIKLLAPGQVLELISTDLGAEQDIPAWCERTGHALLGMEIEGRTLRFYVRKRA